MSRHSRSRRKVTCSPGPRRATTSRRPSQDGPNRIRKTGGGLPSVRSPRSGANQPRSASPARCTVSSSSTIEIECCGRRSCGTTSGRRAECIEIEERVGLTRLIQLTGNRALTGFTAPKLLWLRRHEPDTYARVAHVLLPKDYVRLRLTGEHASDVADASGTLLFDVARRRWSDEMLEALELDPAWLPRALESPEVSGETDTGIPVAAGAGDQAAAALGVGVDRPGPVSVVLGTSGVVFAALPAFAADPQARVHAFCHAVPGGWHAMGVMLSAAGSLRWLRDTLGGRSGYDELTAAAQEWPPGTEGLTFLPYLTGERTPHADPHARAAFAGLDAPPRPRRARPRRPGGCRLRAARLARAAARARGRPARRPRFRWRSSQRALASHHRLGPRTAHPAYGDRRGLRIWSGATRRRGRRSLSRRPRGRRHLCPSARPGRAGPSVGCRV